MESIADPAVLASLLTLTAMEIVLGIDNVIFISIIVGRLPPDQAKRARQLGLALALIFRIALLSVLFILIGLTQPLFELLGHGYSIRDLILLAGGLFLLVKATREIHTDVEGEAHEGEPKPTPSYGATIAQIVVIDMVFSVDSIITAVGMAEVLWVMVAAVIIAVGVMYVAAGAVASFIERHPTTRMLALSFLLMIGFALIADGAGFHIPRGYLYTAMAFSAGVEILNVLARRNRAKRVKAPSSEHP
jgi:predicted tellurium resistance membrane protein TerC